MFARLPSHLPVRRALALTLALTALSIGLAACGGSSSTANGSVSGTQYQARLNLAKCARAHGINIPDPSPNGGEIRGAGRVLRQYPQAQIQAVMQACRQYLVQAFPQLNMSPAQKAKLQQQLVKFAECMRSHGVNIPDPQPGGPLGFPRFGGAFRSIDRNSPVFQAADQACQSLRPQFGPRGGGGGGGAGGGPGG